MGLHLIILYQLQKELIYLIMKNLKNLNFIYFYLIYITIINNFRFMVNIELINIYLKMPIISKLIVIPISFTLNYLFLRFHRKYSVNKYG